MQTPLQMLIRQNAATPEMWRMADMARAQNSQDWPAQVFLPFTHWMRLMGENNKVLNPDTIQVLQLVAALATWRPGQDIVRFDPEVYRSLLESEEDKSLPSEVLWRLPAWGVYIEAPGIFIQELDWDGFIARLDMQGKKRLLRLTFLSMERDSWMDIPFQIGDWSVSEAFTKVMANVFAVLENEGREVPSYEKLFGKSAIAGAINLVLYLCSYGLGDKQGQASVRYPGAKKTKKGWRLFPPDRPKVHILGAEFGRQIREARAASRPSGDHASPRPHIRRAHWHGFWSGPMKGDRRFGLRWLPPIAVAMKEED